jgi:type I restriction enzyme M protein
MIPVTSTNASALVQKVWNYAHVMRDDGLSLGGESERFKRFTYADLMARDKANLDIFWLEDDSLADTENLPKPVVLATEIVEDLEEALEEFSAVEEGSRR